MKSKLIFFIILISGIVIAAESPYARRIRPVASFGTCTENEVAYDMVLHKFGICSNTGYKEITLAGSSSFAPVDAKYITQTANSTLTNEQALNSLATGILKNTTTTGVLSIATEADYLPSQTGNNGKYLTTNGTISSWATVVAGVTANSTTGFLPYLSAANIFSDSQVVRLDANNLELRNGVNNQVQYIYNTWTDATHNQGLKLSGDGTISTFQQNGVDMNLSIIARQHLSLYSGGGGSGAVFLGSGGVDRWIVDNNYLTGIGHFQPRIDNTYDLGSTSFRVRSGYFGTSLSTPILNNGSANIIQSGTPAIAGNGTLNTGSKDSAGKITATGTGASTIVLTFSSAFTRAPACMITNETTANLVRPISTTTTLTVSATIVSGDSLSYICMGY